VTRTAAVGGAPRRAFGVHRIAQARVGGPVAAVYDGDALAVESGPRLATAIHPARNRCDRRNDATVDRCARSHHTLHGTSAH